MDAISGTRQNTATKNKPDIAPGTFLTQLQALCKFWSSVDSQSCPIDSGWRLIYHWKRLESHCCEIPYRIFSPILWGFFWSEPRQLPHLRYVNKKARSFYAAGFVFSLSLACTGAAFDRTFGNRIAGAFTPAAVSYGLHCKNAANSDHMMLSLNSHGERCIIQTVNNMVKHKMLTMIVFCGIALAPFSKRR